MTKTASKKAPLENQSLKGLTYRVNEGLRPAVPVQQAFSKYAVDMKTVATHNIGNKTTSGKRFLVTGISYVVNAQTAITVAGQIRVGTTGTTTTSILGATALAQPATLNAGYLLAPTAGALVIPAGDTLTIGVAVAATGTSQSVDIHVRGFFF